MRPVPPRVTFVTDIATPYTAAVLTALAARVDLTVVFCASRGTRGFAWNIVQPFRHLVLEGLTVHRFDNTDLHLTPRVLTALGRARPDVVISSNYSFPTLYALAYCRARRRPLLLHGDATSDSEGGLSHLQSAMRWLILPHVAGAVANSAPAEGRFRELGVPPPMIFSAPHTTVMQPFWLVAEHRTYDRGRGREVTVLGSGRFVPRKGFDRLLRAFARATADFPTLRLSLVGSGPEEMTLRALAADLGVADWVTFRGFLDQAALPEAYATADVYVFPSLGDPFGIVLLEAMAAGLPVLASPRAGATLDLVRDEETGLCRDPDNIEELAAAIVHLAVDPSARARLGRAAFAATRGRTPEAAAGGYVDAVTAALKGRRRRR